MPPETEAPAAESEAPATPRPFWSGTLTFGLVSVPVNLFPGRRSRRPSLRMLAPDGAPLSRRYFCPIEDRALEPDEIVRGYEHAPGEFVLVTDEELEAVEPEKSRDIDLRVFVPREQLTPFRFGRPYVLTPAGESVKPYRLLASTMERTGRAGIATFVMRGKEYLVAILAANGVLRAETLRFDDELRSPEDVGLPEPGEAPAAEVRRMRDAVKSAERPRPDPRELEDEDGERLRELARRRGRKVELPPEATGEEGATKILDLVAVLKRQLEEGGQA
ncbi:MAG TPA: Ku protein, partial [Longimicrobiales bacterium]|nr:Ku protein [Longimicrobiales bacterium]